jgi:Zn-dependent protease
MKLGGFTLMRVGGIEIVIDYSWFIIFFLVVYTMAESYFPQAHPHYSVPQYWIMGSITAVIFFISILIHEIAHSFVAIKHGVKVTSIRLLVFGGMAQAASEPKNGRHEFLIALSGPAASMALGMIFLTIYSYHLVINRINTAMAKRGDMLTPEDVLELLAVKLIGVVPEDEQVVVSTNRGNPVVLENKSKAGQAFRNIAKRIMGTDVPFLDLDEKKDIFQKLSSILRQ